MKTRKPPTRCACGRFAPRQGACKRCGVVQSCTLADAEAALLAAARGTLRDILAPSVPLRREVILPVEAPAVALRREVLPVVVEASGALPEVVGVAPWLLAPAPARQAPGILARSWRSLVAPGRLGGSHWGMLAIVAAVLTPCVVVLMG